MLRIKAKLKDNVLMGGEDHPMTLDEIWHVLVHRKGSSLRRIHGPKPHIIVQCESCEVTITEDAE